jgi:hypothetical protein
MGGSSRAVFYVFTLHLYSSFWLLHFKSLCNCEFFIESPEKVSVGLKHSFFTSELFEKCTNKSFRRLWKGFAY